MEVMVCSNIIVQVRHGPVYGTCIMGLRLRPAELRLDTVKVYRHSCLFKGRPNVLPGAGSLFTQNPTLALVVYLAQASDKETQALCKAWINQLRKSRQLGMLHNYMCLQKDFLPPLTHDQFWACIKHHSRNPGILKY